MFYNSQEAKNWYEGTSMYRGYSVYRFKIIWPQVHPENPQNPPKKPKKLKISKYVVWGVYGKVWSRRTRKLSFRLKKIFWHTLKAQKPKKIKIFKKRPKRCILLQNQKVCWLLTYHDSFISKLQIYAQKDITPIFITLIRSSHLTDYQRD